LNYTASMKNSPAPSVTPRPWYREPWCWVLIALPLSAVVGSMISLWLALSHPDLLVVDEIEYSKIKSAIKAEPQASGVDTIPVDGADSN